MSRLLLLCPGQGNQHAGMFELARSDARAAALLDSLAPLTTAEPDLFENRHAQPAIVAASAAMWVAIRDWCPRPALVAGYSIGELAAHAVAGALAVPEAVALARLRAGLMDDAARRGSEQCMVAVSGIAPRSDGFAPAIVTGEDSWIAGGLAERLPAFQESVERAGGKLQRLPVGIASHTPWMEAAVAPFAGALEASAFGPYACPVLAGVSAARIGDKAAAVTALSAQLAQTIQWSDCMDSASEAGISVALELGPGAALARMLHQRHPHIACRSVADFRSLQGVRAWLERQLDQSA